jgi:uncharacterized caspase-like protein
MRNIRCSLTILTVLVLGAPFLNAGPSAAATDSNNRLALVVGNSAYRNISALTNPSNDATDIAAKLKTLNFEVLFGIDLTHTQMVALLQQFRSKLTSEHVGLIFYAGHGVTVNNESFLLPVDLPEVLDLDSEGRLTSEALNRHLIGMATMLSPLEQAKIGIVFLDACRTSLTTPGLGLTLRTASLAPGRTAARLFRGTGSVDIKPSPYSAGVFRAYATQLDNVASDGAGRNSPFTKALLKFIGQKGLSIQELMIEVRKSVIAETKSAQIPWEEAALNERFYFVPATTSGPPAPGSPDRKRNPVQRQPSNQPGNRLPPNLGVGVGTGL